MEFVNAVSNMKEGITHETVTHLLVLLSPFAPHFACELWEYLGFSGMVFDSPWPAHDPRFLEDDEVEIGVQVKGKFRGSILIPSEASRESVLEMAMSKDFISRHIGEGPFRKVIYVKGRVLNIIP